MNHIKELFPYDWGGFRLEQHTCEDPDKAIQQHKDKEEAFQQMEKLQLRLPQPVPEFKTQCIQETPAPDAQQHADPQILVDWIRKALETSPGYNQDVENLIVVGLTSSNRIICWEIISQGTLDQILMHPRDIFKRSCAWNAAKIVILHNHPSGDPTPSAEDIRATKVLVKAGRIMCTQILDHIILGKACLSDPKGWVSLRESSLLD